MGIVVNLKQISLDTLDMLQKSPTLCEAFFNAQYLPESHFWNTSGWTSECAERSKQEARIRFDRCVFRFLRHRLPFGDRLSDFLAIEIIPKFIKHYNSHTQPRKPEHLAWHQEIEQRFLAEWETPELDLGKTLHELTFLLSGYVPSYYRYSDGLLPDLEPYRNRVDGDFMDFLVIDSVDHDSPPFVNAIGAGTLLEYETGYGPVRYLLPNENEQILRGLLRLTQEKLKERCRTELQKEKPCPWLTGIDEESLEELLEWGYDAIHAYYTNAVQNQRAMLLYLC